MACKLSASVCILSMEVLPFNLDTYSLECWNDDFSAIFSILSICGPVYAHVSFGLPTMSSAADFRLSWPSD